MNGRIVWAAALVGIFGGVGTASATAGQSVITPTTVEPAQSAVRRAEDDVSNESISRANASAVFHTVFDCEGSLLHQSVDGEIETPLSFWLGVRENHDVAGMVTKTGFPLELPAHSITGELTANHDFRDEFIGGKLSLIWPFSQDGERVELAVMRETFVRVGPRVNGVSKIIRRTSNHTYVAGRMRFDPKSHPALASMRRISFVAATCFPTPGLPAVAGPKM